MHFDIANLALNIWQQSHKFEWGSFFTALFGAFFGALSAFLFNQFTNCQKEKEQNIINSNSLLCLLATNISDLYACYLQIQAIRQNIISQIRHKTLPKGNYYLIAKFLNDINNKNYYFILLKESMIYSQIVSYFSSIEVLQLSIQKYNNIIDKRFDKNYISNTKTCRKILKSILETLKYTLALNYVLYYNFLDYSRDMYKLNIDYYINEKSKKIIEYTIKNNRFYEYVRKN